MRARTASGSTSRSSDFLWPENVSDDTVSCELDADSLEASLPLPSAASLPPMLTTVTTTTAPTASQHVIPQAAPATVARASSTRASASIASMETPPQPPARAVEAPPDLNARVAPDESLPYVAPDLPTRSFKTLQRFYKQGVLCDVILRTDTREISCHRLVLACISPYFHAMFTSNLRESVETVVEIHELNSDALQAIVDYAYSSQIRLSPLSIQPLLHAASVLQIDNLEFACCQYIKDKILAHHNCLGIWHFAVAHGLHGLSDAVQRFILRNWPAIVANGGDEFLNIDPMVLEQLLDSSKLCVESEIQVYECVLKWLSVGGRSSDQRLVARLLSKIRLPLLPSCYLRNTVLYDFYDNIDCRNLIDQAKDYQLWRASLLSGEAPISSDRFEPRKSYAGILFCIGGRDTSGGPCASIEFYSVLDDRWFRGVDMKTRRRHVAACSVAGKVYAVGGCEQDNRHLCSCEMFTPSLNQWRPLAPMRTPRRGLGVCALNIEHGPIYAVGGLDDINFFNTVERYDIMNNSWTSVAPMLTPRGGVAVVAVQGTMYAFGGNVGQTSLSTCEKYDPHLDRWTYIAPMKHRRAGAAAVVGLVDKYIYVFGGFDNNVPLKSAELYDLERDEWTQVSPMCVARGGVGGASLANRVYAVGGHDGIKYLDSVEVYDPIQNTWSFAHQICKKRAGAGVTHCTGSLFQLIHKNKHLNAELNAELDNIC
ncbi:kelch protein 8-like [Tropilaelaps mercedesae]|uniref:Kelch protein 8-like n=1 Tax=Tropilaelaps mercedesae TaxID=418985 RepID=A0A1V9XJG3_9ACAR|nr:kelch protein 8-like [Tropilaelaps mercedesae]